MKVKIIEKKKKKAFATKAGSSNENQGCSEAFKHFTLMTKKDPFCLRKSYFTCPPKIPGVTLLIKAC
jgi:hypothetical protein